MKVLFPFSKIRNTFARSLIHSLSTVAGAQDTTISIASNDPDENPFTFKVNGVVLATSLEKDTWWKDRVTIYPNPANEFVKVSFQNLQGKTVQLILKDSQGRTLQTLETSATINLPTENLPAGAYQVYLQVGKHKIILPLIKK